MKKELHLTYYAKIKKEDKVYISSFRDLDNIFSEGDTLEECLFNTQEALNGVLMAMVETECEIPLPSTRRDKEYAIPVNPEVSAPVLLFILRREKAKTMSQVARIMHIPYQQYQRLESHCNMTLKTLHRAAAALGARVEIRLYAND